MKLMEPAKKNLVDRFLADEYAADYPAYWADAIIAGREGRTRDWEIIKDMFCLASEVLGEDTD